MEAVFTRKLHHAGFTSKYICYYYQLPLSSKHTSLGALLGNVLTRGSKDYPNLRAIRDKEDDLYGTVVYFDMNKYGDQLVFEAKLIMPNFSMLTEEKMEEEAMDFFHSLLYRPLLDENGNFYPEIFSQEVEMLYQELDGLNKDPSSYAHRKCIELLFEGGALGQYKYGDRATLMELSLDDLKEFYQKMIQDCPLYIYKHGEEQDEVEGERLPYELSRLDLTNVKERKVIEDRKVRQSILVKSYRVPWDFMDDRHYPMVVFSHLFGGYASNLLFRKVREEKGLCYSIYTKLDKYRQMMLLITGHEKSRHDELEEAIAETLQEIVEGDFSLKELEEAKQDLSISLGSLVDAQGQLLNYEFVQDLFCQDASLQERIERIKEVKKEEVMEVAKTLMPALSFYLREE